MVRVNPNPNPNPNAAFFEKKRKSDPTTGFTDVR